MSRLIKKIIKDINQDLTLSGSSIISNDTHTIDGHQVTPFDPTGINPIPSDDVTGSVSVDETTGHGSYPVVNAPDHGTPGDAPYNYNIPAPAHEDVHTVLIQRKVR